MGEVFSTISAIFYNFHPQCFAIFHLQLLYIYSRMKIKIDIPDYISVSNYKKIHNLEHLTMSEKMFTIVHTLSGLEEDIVRKIPLKQLAKIQDDLLSCLDQEPIFHPLIEWNSTLLGYQNINNMSLGEYTDLERFLKAPNDNLDEICAIMFRPVVKHRFNGFTYQLKRGLKIAKHNYENPFKYYNVEEYDSDKRDATIFNDFPVQYILGAMSFFLLSVSNYLTDTNQSLEVTEEMKKMIKTTSESHLASIGVGLEQFITSQKAPSLTSQETKVLSTVI